MLYYNKSDSKLESQVIKGMFFLYEKSDKQYQILPRGGQNLKLVINSEFQEQEDGYLSKIAVDKTAKPSIKAPA